MRIQAQTEEDSGYKHHFVALILKGWHCYLHGGEQRVNVFKISNEMIMDVMFTKTRRDVYVRI